MSSPHSPYYDENEEEENDFAAYDEIMNSQSEYQDEVYHSNLEQNEEAELEDFKKNHAFLKILKAGASTPTRKIKDKENNDTTNTPPKASNDHLKRQTTPPNSQPRVLKKNKQNRPQRRINPLQIMKHLAGEELLDCSINFVRANMLNTGDSFEDELGKMTLNILETEKKKSSDATPLSIVPVVHEVDIDTNGDPIGHEEEHHFLSGHSLKYRDAGLDEREYLNMDDMEKNSNVLQEIAQNSLFSTENATLPETMREIPKIVSEQVEQSRFFAPSKTAGEYVAEVPEDTIYQNQIYRQVASAMYKPKIRTGRNTAEDTLIAYNNAKNNLWQWVYDKDPETQQLRKAYMENKYHEDIRLQVDKNDVIYFKHLRFPRQRFYVSCKASDTRSKEIFNLVDSEEAMVLAKKSKEAGLESVYPQYAFVASTFIVIGIEKHFFKAKNQESEQTHRSGASFIYTIFHSPADFFVFTDVFKGQERVFQEIIIQEHRPVFDIERSLKGLVPHAAKELLEFLRDGTSEKYFVPLLADYIHKYFGVRVTREEILIIDSSDVTAKFSMHVTVSTNAGHFLKCREDGVVFLYGFAQYIEDYVYNDPVMYSYFFFNEFDKNAKVCVKSIIDFGVFTAGQRNMRMIGAVKGASEFTNVKDLSEMRLFRPYGKGSSDVYFYRYMCTVNYGTFRTPFMMPEEIAQRVYEYGHVHSKAWDASHWQFALPKTFTRCFQHSSYHYETHRRATNESLAAYAARLPVSRQLHANPNESTTAIRSNNGKILREITHYPRWSQEADKNYIRCFCEARDANHPFLQTYLNIYEYLLKRFAMVIHPRLRIKPIISKFNSIMIGEKNTAVLELRIFPTEYFETHGNPKDKCCLFGCGGGSHDVSITINLDFSISYYCFACTQRKTFENFRIGGNYLAPMARHSEIPDYMKVGMIDYLKLKYEDDIEQGSQIYSFNRAHPGYMQEVQLPEEYDEYATIVLHGPMGSGKTHTMKKLLEDAAIKKKEKKMDQDVDICVLSIGFRIVLSLAAALNLDLTFYKDVSKAEKMHDFKRLAIQLESLPKLLKNVKESGGEIKIKLENDYDVVILDESESLLAQFGSSTMKDDNRVFAIFRYLVMNTRYLIVADADIGPRTYELLKLRAVTRNGGLTIPNLVYHHNSDGSIKTKFIDYHSLDAFYAQMIKTLLQIEQDGTVKSIFIASNARAKLNGLIAMLKEDLWEKLIDLHSAFGVARDYFEKVSSLAIEKELLKRNIDKLEAMEKNKKVAISEYLNDPDPAYVTSGPEGGNIFQRFQLPSEKKLVQMHMRFEDLNTAYHELLQRVGLSAVENSQRLPRNWLRTPGVESFVDLEEKNKRYFNIQAILMNIEVIDVNTDEKKKDRMTNANNEWNRYRVLAISPTIGAGIDYSGENFDSTFIYACNHSCSARSLNQMRGRVRYPRSMKTHIFFEPYILCSDPKEKVYSMIETNVNKNEEKIRQKYYHMQNAGSFDQNGIFHSVLTPEYVKLRADILTEIDCSHNDMRTSMINLLRSPTLQYIFDLAPFGQKDRYLTRRLLGCIIKTEKHQIRSLAEVYADPDDPDDFDESLMDQTSVSDSLSQADTSKNMQRISSDNTMSSFASQSQLSVAASTKSTVGKKEKKKKGESHLKRLNEFLTFFGFERDRGNFDRIAEAIELLQEKRTAVRNFIITTCCSRQELEALQTDCYRAPLAAATIHESNMGVDGILKEHETRLLLSSSGNELHLYQIRDYFLRVAWIVGFHITPYDYSKREFETKEEFPRSFGEIPSVLPFLLQQAHKVTCIRRLEIPGVNDWLNKNYEFIVRGTGCENVLSKTPIAEMSEFQWSYTDVYNLFKSMCHVMMSIKLIKTVPSKYKKTKKKAKKPTHSFRHPEDEDSDMDDETDSQYSEMILTQQPPSNGIRTRDRGNIVLHEQRRQQQKSNGIQYHKPNLASDDTFKCCLGCETNMQHKIPNMSDRAGKCEVALFNTGGVASLLVFAFYHLFRPIEAEHELSLKPFRDRLIAICEKCTGIVKKLPWNDLRSTMADPVPQCIFVSASANTQGADAASTIEEESDGEENGEKSRMEQRALRSSHMIISKSKDKQIELENIKRKLYIEKYSIPPPEDFKSIEDVVRYFANPYVKLKVEMEMRQIEVDHAKSVNERESARMENLDEQIRLANENISRLEVLVNEEAANTSLREELIKAKDRLDELVNMEKEYGETMHLWQINRKFTPIYDT
jgi:hypothetical protein